MGHNHSHVAIFIITPVHILCFLCSCRQHPSRLLLPNFLLFKNLPTSLLLLSAAEKRGTLVLLSASVSDNFGNSPQISAPRRSCEIDQSTQRFLVGWFHVCWQGIGDQSDAVTQNAWFCCALCAAISGEISILIRTGAEFWGRFPVPRICCWERTLLLQITHFTFYTKI